MTDERGGWGTSQSLPQWYIRPLQCSVALKSTVLTFQLCSNYIHVLGKAATTKQPVVFYELTTGTLSQPPVTWDLGCPQRSPPADPPVCERSGPSSAMPRFFLLRHLAPFTRQPCWLKTGHPYPTGFLEVSGCREGEQSGLGGGQQPTRVRPHQLSVGIYKGSRHLSWPAGFGGSRLGFLPSQRLPAPEMLHCTHFLF